MIQAWVLVLLAGCFSKPGLGTSDGGGSGSDGGMDADADAPIDMAACDIPENGEPGMALQGGRVARWPSDMILGFGDPLSHVPQPILFDISTGGVDNLLADNAPCNNEDRVGVGFYPFGNSAASSSAMGHTNLALEVVVNGPAYAELLASWHKPFTCGGQASVAIGSTRWGLFPDGRIVRFDVATGSSVPLDLQDCTTAGDVCVMGSASYILTSYFAFARDALAELATLPSTTEVALPATGTSGTIMPGACLVDADGNRIALRWDAYTNPLGADARVRATVGTEPQISLVADLYEAQAPTGDEPIPLPTAPPHSVRTTILTSPQGLTSCADLQNRAGQLATQQPLFANSATIDNELINHVAAQYYAARDELEFENVVEINTTGGTALPNFLLSIKMPGTRIRTSRAADRVIWHHDPQAGRFYLFFRDPLPPNETLTLTSGC